MVKEWEDLLKYFPDLDPPKLPERRFILGILWTLRKTEMRELIKTANFNRSIKTRKAEDDLVAMTLEVKEEIFRLLPKKSIFIFNYNSCSNSRESSISAQAGSEAAPHEGRAEEISCRSANFKAPGFRWRGEGFWLNKIWTLMQTSAITGARSNHYA